MYSIGQLHIIGSSHISPESVKEVRKVIKEKEPQLVAIELDKGRLAGLLGKKGRLRLEDVMKLGIRGTLFTLVGSWISERLGKLVGTKPGDEMKAAVHSAAKVKAKVVLIDQEIQKTVKRLFKALTWREKFRFVGDFFKGIIFRQPQIEGFDLRKVPSEKIIEELIGMVEKRYPNFYKVLIHERNVIMARRLNALRKKHPDAIIVAVVGAGHVKGMIELLEK